MPTWGSPRAQLVREYLSRCLQAEQSLASAGAGDPYKLWYMGWMTLLGFCEDGDQFIHQISSGHAKYNTANVDAHFAQTIGEITTKGIGPPTCAKIDAARPGVCGGCPFTGKVVSPIKLGYPVDPVADLPDSYGAEQRTHRSSGWPR